MYKNIFSIDNRPNWADEIFVIKNSKMHRYVYMPQKTLMVKKLSLLFMINTKQTVFSAENVIKKVIICIFNGKVITIHLIVGLMLINDTL